MPLPWSERFRFDAGMPGEGFTPGAGFTVDASDYNVHTGNYDYDYDCDKGRRWVLE